VAARYGSLPVFGPSNFSQWTIANKHGWTVALEPTGHEAAKFGHLPVSGQCFDQWGLVDNEGMTVAMVAKNVGGSSAAIYHAWLVNNSLENENYAEISILL
jgi:hypothetical protein